MTLTALKLIGKFVLSPDENVSRCPQLFGSVRKRLTSRFGEAASLGLASKSRLS